MSNLTMMIRQMATLIKARIPLDEALSALVEQTDDTKLKSILAQIRTSVNEGRSLADSCRQFPKVFSPIFIAMIQVGEASGNLDLVLNRLANFAEAQLDLRNKVIGAMVYPAFMVVAGLGITIFLFAFAVPKITEVFAGSKIALPMLTLIMIKISDVGFALLASAHPKPGRWVFAFYVVHQHQSRTRLVGRGESAHSGLRPHAPYGGGVTFCPYLKYYDWQRRTALRRHRYC